MLDPTSIETCHSGVKRKPSTCALPLPITILLSIGIISRMSTLSLPHYEQLHRSHQYLAYRSNVHVKLLSTQQVSTQKQE